uniref:Uncharacterized protein n=1 Tax=Anguilla anguilla TaxID=7936 RepID=A0A0E9R7R7_ANGAN
MLLNESELHHLQTHMHTLRSKINVHVISASPEC